MNSLNKMLKNMYGKTAIIISMVLLCVQACVAPFGFTIRDDRYESEQPSLIIVPVYANVERIQLLQRSLPLFQDFDIDSAYVQYEYLYNKFDDTEKERRNIFYLIISTRF